MWTESGLAEFVLGLRDGVVWLIERADEDGEHITHLWRVSDYEKYDVVKAYGSPDWMQVRSKEIWEEGVIIGYCERRLTPEEEKSIRRFVASYWDLPF